MIGDHQIPAGLERREQLAVHLGAIDLHVAHVMIGEKERDQIEIAHLRRQRVVVVADDMDDALHRGLLGAQIELVLDLPLDDSAESCA